MMKIVSQNFPPYIWGSPALKFQLRQKTVGKNGAEK